jgi:hypothetical protein
MARPKLLSVKILPNHGAMVVYKSTREGVIRQFRRPDEHLSTFEAAHLLGTYPIMVGRMVKSGTLKGARGPFGYKVSLPDIRRVMRLPASKRIGAVSRNGKR